MATSGDIFESIATGERIEFRRTAADTNGSVVEFDLFVAPGGRPGAPHAHLTSEEKFKVLKGSITFFIDGEKNKLQTGDTITIPAGTPHDFRNFGNEEVHMRGWVEPAYRFEELMETFFALSALGKTNSDGRPGLLQTISILHRLREEYRVEVVPYWVQRFIFPPVAGLAHLLGYSAIVSYPSSDKNRTNKE